MDNTEVIRQALACRESPTFFALTFVQILSVEEKAWLPFDLWPEQGRVLRSMADSRRMAILKARQLGMTWLALAYTLWLMLFRAPAHILLYSIRDTEATDLLDRLKRMYKLLPEWMKCREIEAESGHEFRLSNGSLAKAFPSSAGDSYTASLVVVDEADLVPDLNDLLSRVQPTVDAGGQLFLIGRVDKSRPLSPFKQVFRGAWYGTDSDWTGIFLPWSARPTRTPEWYAAKKREILQRTGSLDELYEQYPETPEQALAPRSLDKRFPPEWVQKAWAPREPMDDEAMASFGAPAIPGLKMWMPPQPGARYGVGVDPAEGNPGSDESPVAIKSFTGEQVALLAGQTEPTITAENAIALALYYNEARILVERNNHGHAVIGHIRERGYSRLLLQGYDASANASTPKYGWLNNGRGKALMCTTYADALRDGQVTMHDYPTYEQVASIDGASLSAPSGQPDDRAVAEELSFIATQMPSGPAPDVTVVFRRG